MSIRSLFTHRATVYIPVKSDSAGGLGLYESERKILYEDIPCRAFPLLFEANEGTSGGGVGFGSIEGVGWKILSSRPLPVDSTVIVTDRRGDAVNETRIRIHKSFPHRRGYWAARGSETVEYAQ